MLHLVKKLLSGSSVLLVCLYRLLPAGFPSFSGLLSYAIFALGIAVLKIVRDTSHYEYDTTFRALYSL